MLLIICVHNCMTDCACASVMQNTLTISQIFEEDALKNYTVKISARYATEPAKIFHSPKNQYFCL